MDHAIKSCENQGRFSRMDHLKYSGVSNAEQIQALENFVRQAPVLLHVLAVLRDMDLNDPWIVSGAIYNNVWNWLTDRPLMTGVKDIDVFYFDDSDLSYEAEDRIIKNGEKLFSDISVPIEIRNQARVHLWYEDHFGFPCDPIKSCQDSINRFASRTHCVGIRLDGAGQLDIYAPYGLDDIFSFRVVPNRMNENSATYTKKGARALGVWPEIEVVPW